MADESHAQHPGSLPRQGEANRPRAGLEAPNGCLTLLFLVVPLLCMLPGLHLLVLSPVAIGQFEQDPVGAILAMAMLVGVFSAPGCYYSAFATEQLAAMRRAGRAWIVASLAGCMAACLVALFAWFLFLGPLGLVVPLGTIGLWSLLLERVMAAWSSCEFTLTLQKISS